jgi:carbohydrate-selective porin OprB
MLCDFALPAYCQTGPGETLSGPESHEMRRDPSDLLLGDWGGIRSDLFERGVRFDFQYISDTLWGDKSQQRSQFASWNRFRATVDIDLGSLAGWQGWYFHATALTQGGGNLGADLGLLTGPSGMASADTTRLDSWWIEKRWLDERVIVRAGQFAGQDFYGTQHFGASYIFEPMGYALGNLFTTFESFDPFSTPAMELRIIPLDEVYLKSMVLASDRTPFSNNPTGLVPQFRDDPVVVSEIGYTPGQKASGVRAVDDVESRKGYSGLYVFGAAYNPGEFVAPASGRTRSGNYLLYWQASQAIWRVDPQDSRGLDATFAFDWSPPDVNRNNTQLTAGLRLNEPLPLGFHNTMSFGYVRNSLSSQFSRDLPAPKSEQGFEFNVLLLLGPFLVQPVIQHYENVGGGTQRASVFGFRTKVEF